MRMFELQSASAEHKRVLLKRVKVNLSHIVSIQSIVKQIGGGDSSKQKQQATTWYEYSINIRNI